MDPLMRNTHPIQADSLERKAASSAMVPGNHLAAKPRWESVMKRSFPQLPREHVVTRSTVLSVDDNDDLRRVMELTLGFLGFDVISCPDADAASRAYRDSADVDLLVTDLEMPGRSGIELARELCALSPSLPVLIVSGAYFTAEIKREVEQSSWRFLAKPYAVPEFSANINDLLRLGSTRRQPAYAAGPSPLSS